MPTSIDALIRRIKPHKRAKRLVRRPGKDLPYIGDNPLVGPVMFDTTVYIHVAQGKAPPAVLATLAGGGAHLHASVCLAEIAVSLGRLDPGHARTKSRSSYLTELLRKTPAHRVHSPTADDWMSAGLLAGTVARLFDAAGRDRYRLLNDCLLLFVALREGATLLTANIRDFDPMTQIIGDAKVVFYRAA